jgi:tellurite resistance protein
MGIFWIIVGVIVVVALLNGNSDQTGNSTQGRSGSDPDPSPRGSSPRRSPPPRATMGNFEIRASENKNWRGKGLHVLVFEGRGLMPVNRTMEIEFVTWMQDITDDRQGEPVFCSIDDFQHHEHPGFQCVRGGGTLAPDQGFRDWVEVGIAPAESLSFPASGTRSLRINCYITEKTAPAARRSLVSNSCSLYFNNTGIGYKEWQGKRVEALELSLRLGVATAFADDDFEDSEGRAIKNWLKKRIDRLPDDEQAPAKTELNEALVQAYADARAGRLSIDSAAASLKQSPIKQASYDALELCTLVMAADGVIHPEELRIINRVGQLLGIDNDAIRSLRDKHAPAAQPMAAGDGAVSDEMLLGIEAGLTPEQLRKKLRELFGRYNAMLQIEKDRDKRARYQAMLDAIARLTSRSR